MSASFCRKCENTTDHTQLYMEENQGGLSQSVVGTRILIRIITIPVVIGMYFLFKALDIELSKGVLMVICVPICMFIFFLPVFFSNNYVWKCNVCGTVKSNTQKDQDDLEKWQKLKLGDTVDRILLLIGKPTEKKVDDKGYENWLYIVENKGWLMSETYEHRVIIFENKVAEVILDSDLPQNKRGIS